MPHLTILALNADTQDAAFDEVRGLDAGIEIVHARYRTSWEDISARRRGETPPGEEVIADDLRAALARADVMLAFLVPRDLARLAPRLRWLSTLSTGIDHLRGTGILESQTTVTTVGGLMAPVIAEHVFAGMLYFSKHISLFEECRRARVWRMERVRELTGRTVGVVGVGAIGSAVAVRAKAFGMQVIGLGRNVDGGRVVAGVDRLLPRAGLAELLATADYVVLAVADTPETRGMIGAAELAMMRSDAVLVNVARGTVIDEAALVEVLRAGRIAGAALDVFAVEPLPADSPLWELPNVFVTPHVAPNTASYLPRAIHHFAANVRRFLAGQPLADEFDRNRGY